MPLCTILASSGSSGLHHSYAYNLIGDNLVWGAKHSALPCTQPCAPVSPDQPFLSAAWLAGTL